MLDLLTKREEIQKPATEQLGQRFKSYDINVVAVLIGRPESKEIAAGKADPIDLWIEISNCNCLRMLADASIPLRSRFDPATIDHAGTSTTLTARGRADYYRIVSANGCQLCFPGFVTFR
jgi:hypothetical protein